MSSPTRRVINLILDWDGTLTHKDTLHLVAKIGYDKQGLPMSGPIDYPLPMLSWETISSKYMDEYKRHKMRYKPMAADRSCLSDERAWLASLKPIEVYGARTAESAQIFRGVEKSDIRTAAQVAVDSGDLVLRRGWNVLASHALAAGSLSILSVNWSATFIRCALLASLRTTKDTIDDALCKYVETDLRIDANDIQECDRVGGSLGELRQRNEADDVRTSADKLLRLPERCQSLLEDRNASSSVDEALVVYCGDSDTDLECLLAADVGVCFRDGEMTGAQKSLAITLERLRVQVKPIEDFSINSLSETCLWTAHDFHQILNALKILEVPA
ncbi:hypothetical protein K461DRAFT_272941 [Myriangium duriaei CBS 260.36]|uniref:Haloacid dehalogenase-like hydrolase n=1 Tax=Myriangium duriaei CBS 260.36 TaxID=1168546 RepID=A0A9P4MRS2_9PEZI|nr:hypothetical protein K461DRAFT_272941 [Myriangium duriaei CBS 260.36]